MIKIRTKPYKEDSQSGLDIINVYRKTGAKTTVFLYYLMDIGALEKVIREIDNRISKGKKSSNQLSRNKEKGKFPK